MASPRRIAGPNAKNRAVLLDAAERVMLSLSPVVLSVLLTSLSRVLVMEQALGMSAGHADTVELVECWLRRLDDSPPT